MISQCLQHKRKFSINESLFISAFNLDLLYICKFRRFLYALRGFGLRVHVFSNSQTNVIVKVQLTCNTRSLSTNFKLKYLLKLILILTVIIKLQIFLKRVCFSTYPPPPKKDLGRLDGQQINHKIDTKKFKIILLGINYHLGKRNSKYLALKF